MIVLDTSGLYAFLSSGQQDHAAVAEVVHAEPGPFLLSPFVLAELGYLLLTKRGVEAEVALLREVASGAYDLVRFDANDVAATVDVFTQYQDLEIGLADASIAVIAAKMHTTRLLTLDERDFRAIRPLWGGEAFTLLPADDN